MTIVFSYEESFYILESCMHGFFGFIDHTKIEAFHQTTCSYASLTLIALVFAEGMSHSDTIQC